MKKSIKKLVSYLPLNKQKVIKKAYFRNLIRKQRFHPDEKEYDLIDNWLNPGDWVVDVGANVGHYTKKFSELVGPNGRVIAFEPIPFTFDILSSNVTLFDYENTTLINAAVSDTTSIVNMHVPINKSGLENYYMATINDNDGDLKVLSVSLDDIFASNPVKLVKIDAEGHELNVLYGMKSILKNVKPLIIVENSSNDLYSFLKHYGYVSTQLQDSPNIIFG